MLLRSALKNAPERVESATRTFDVMNDLLIVAHVALETLEDAPGVTPANADELAALRQKATSAASALHKADAILRSTNTNKDSAIAAEDVNVIVNALAESRGVAVQVEDKLSTVRSQVSTLREQIPNRLRIAAWSIFVLSMFGAFGQVALVRWRLCSRCR